VCVEERVGKGKKERDRSERVCVCLHVCACTRTCVCAII